MDTLLLVKCGLTLGSIILYLIAFSVTRRFIRSFGSKRDIAEKRVVYTKKFFNTFLILFLFVSLIFIWGIEVKGIFLFASSFFAFVGIALFASWSILSNITTSIVMFFSFPYKIGDHIRVIDGENSVEGCIKDMTFFNIHIECNDGNITYYPNNLAVQKPVAKLKGKKEAPDPVSTQDVAPPE